MRPRVHTRWLVFLLGVLNLASISLPANICRESVIRAFPDDIRGAHRIFHAILSVGENRHKCRRRVDGTQILHQRLRVVERDGRIGRADIALDAKTVHRSLAFGAVLDGGILDRRWIIILHQIVDKVTDPVALIDMFRYFRQFVSVRTRSRHLQAHPCLVTPARSSLGTSLIFQVLAGH